MWFSLMKYNFNLFFKSFYKSFFKAKGTHAHLTRKRLGFLFLFYFVWPVWGIVIWFTLFLDNLFFKNFKDQAVEKPLFITGNFRSGSTFLQRLIAKDNDHFLSARTWDIFLSPTITLTRLFSVIYSLDGKIGSPIKRIFRNFDQRTLGQVDIHHISFFEPEEDENFLLHNWSSYFGGILFPFIEDYKQYLFFDHQIKEEKRAEIMQFYHGLIQRFLYARGGKRRLLSKNPSISPKIASIYEAFPTARIVYLVRNPLEMLPSTISWLGYVWRVFSDPNETYPFTQEILEFCKHWYQYPLSILEKTDPNKYLIIKYNDLVHEPQRTIKHIYSHFGYTMSPQFEEQILASAMEAEKFRSKHEYVLDEMGISRKEVLKEFSDIFDRFGFDRNVKGVSPIGKESTLD